MTPSVAENGISGKPREEREIPRGRKREGLRNRREVVGTGRDGWRIDTMGLRSST